MVRSTSGKACDACRRRKLKVVMGHLLVLVILLTSYPTVFKNSEYSIAWGSLRSSMSAMHPDGLAVHIQ